MVGKRKTLDGVNWIKKRSEKNIKQDGVYYYLSDLLSQRRFWPSINYQKYPFSRITTYYWDFLLNPFCQLK